MNTTKPPDVTTESGAPMVKTIRVDEETWRALGELGQFGETYCDVIKRLIEREKAARPL